MQKAQWEIDLFVRHVVLVGVLEAFHDARSVALAVVPHAHEAVEQNAHAGCYGRDNNHDEAFGVSGTVTGVERKGSEEIACILITHQHEEHILIAIALEYHCSRKRSPRQ